MFLLWCDYCPTLTQQENKLLITNDMQASEGSILAITINNGELSDQLSDYQLLTTGSAP
jgi:hypothetical protein